MAEGTKQPKIVDYSIRESSDTQFENVTWDFLKERCVSIIEATEMLNGTNPNYYRRVLLMGRLEGVKIQQKGFQKWYVTLESIKWYKQYGRRSDTLRRHNLYIKLADQEKVKQLFEANEIEFRLEVAYQNGRED